MVKSATRLKETSQLEELKQKRAKVDAHRTCYNTPNCRTHTMWRNNMLLPTVKRATIAPINYRLLATKIMKDDLERLEIAKILFCTTLYRV